MRKAVWASYYHRISTDDFPRHVFCPGDESTWCRYNKAKICGNAYHHKHPLPQSVAVVIRPVYKSLSDPALLRKCLHGQTQNPNESLNSVIWSKIPKTVFVGYNTFSVGVYDAVLIYNEGCMGKIKGLKQLGLEVGVNAQTIFKEIDKQRLYKSEYKQLVKHFKKRNINRKRKLEDEEENPDDPAYGAGCIKKVRVTSTRNSRKLYFQIFRYIFLKN